MRGNLVINFSAAEASLQKRKYLGRYLGRGYPAGPLSFSADVQPLTRDTAHCCLGEKGQLPGHGEPPGPAAGEEDSWCKSSVDDRWLSKEQSVQ